MLSADSEEHDEHYEDGDNEEYEDEDYNEDCYVLMKCPKENCDSMFAKCQNFGRWDNKKCYNHSDEDQLLPTFDCCNCKQVVCGECCTFTGGPKNDTSEPECYDCLNKKRTIPCANCKNRVNKYKICYNKKCSKIICLNCINDKNKESFYCPDHK